MTNAATLDAAWAELHQSIIVAEAAHALQRDKSGAKYIGHPQRVAMALIYDRLPAVCAALLHDVIEDTNWSLDDLRGVGIREDVINAVDVLTRRTNEDYNDYIDRVEADPIARAVKLADIDDNSDEERLAKLDGETRERLRAKYDYARRRLTAATGEACTPSLPQ